MTDPELSRTVRQLRTEVIAILRASRTIEVRDARLDPRQRVELAEEVARRAERCRDLLDDALGFSAEHPSLRAPIANAVIAAVDDVREFARFCRVRLRHDVGDGLRVAIARDTLRLAITTVLIDAVRLAEPDSDVLVESRQRGARVAVDVIFSRTSVADADRGGGTGPGGWDVERTLAIVGGVVEPLGGTVTARIDGDTVTCSMLLPEPAGEPAGDTVLRMPDRRVGA